MITISKDIEAIIITINQLMADNKPKSREDAIRLLDDNNLRCGKPEEMAIMAMRIKKNG